MAAEPKPAAQQSEPTGPEKYLPIARIAASALAVALIVYGLRIPVIDRLTSGQTPPASSFLAALSPIGVGAMFLILQSQFDRRPWALPVCNVLSLLLLFLTAATALTEGVQSVALFPLIFAPMTAYFTWVACPSRQPDLSGPMPTGAAPAARDEEFARPDENA